MTAIDASQPFRATSNTTVDFLGSMSFAAYATAITSPWNSDDNRLIENLLNPDPSLDPPPASDPLPGVPPPTHYHPNDRVFDTRKSFFEQFYFDPVTTPAPTTGTLTLLFDSWFTVSTICIENPFGNDDLVINYAGGTLVLRDFLNPIHKGSPFTQVRLAVNNGVGWDVVTQSTTSFFTDYLSQTTLDDAIAWFADSFGSGGGAHDVMYAVLNLAQREFKAGHLDASMFELDRIDSYFWGSTEHLKHTSFYADFRDRLQSGTFTVDDVQVYTLLRLLRSDSRDPWLLPNQDSDLVLDHLTKAAFFAGYQASVEAIAAPAEWPLDALHAMKPTPMTESALVHAMLQAMQVDDHTQQAVHALFQNGTALLNGNEVSLYLVPPSTLPSGAQGALVTEASGRRLLLVSQLLDPAWRNAVVTEELASLLAQGWEAQTQSELPGDEGRYVLAHVVRDIVQSVRAGGPDAATWQAAYDALPTAWTHLSDAALDQSVVRASLSNDKYKGSNAAQDLTYELSSWGDWTAPVAGAVAGVIAGAALGTAGLLVAGPVGAGLGAKAGLETGLLVAGLSALGGGALGSAAGAAYASAEETQPLQQAITHQLTAPASPLPVEDVLEATLREPTLAPPENLAGFLALAQAGMSYAQIMAMPGVDKVALARGSALLPTHATDNSYFSNLENASGFESLGAVLSAAQQQTITQRIDALLPSPVRSEVVQELLTLTNARGMLGNLLKTASPEGIDVVLNVYQNLRQAYMSTATQDVFKTLSPLSWQGETGFWAFNEKTKAAGEDIAAQYVTNGAYKSAEGNLADMAFAQLTSLLEKPDLLNHLDPNAMARLLRYLTQTTLVSQAADLEMLRLAHVLETHPSQEALADVFSLLLGSAAGGMKTLEERGFRLLASQTEHLREEGTVSQDLAFMAPQIMQVVNGFQAEVLTPASHIFQIIGPAHEAGFGEFGPSALLRGAQWEDLLFSKQPLATQWQLDARLLDYIQSHSPFIQSPSTDPQAMPDVFSANHLQDLLRDGEFTDTSGQFTVSLRLVDPATIADLPGQVSARKSADGWHHIEVLISRALAPADRDAVLFEELNNVDEYLYTVRHETDPAQAPLTDAITVGDRGGRALLAYEMHLRDTFGEGLPMFSHLSNDALGYAMAIETLNDDRYVDSYVAPDGSAQTVTLYANTNSSVSHPPASKFVSFRPALYFSLHTGYGLPEASLNPFKSYLDMSRLRLQFSLDPDAHFNQGPEKAAGQARPVSDSWASFDITLENLASLQLGTPRVPSSATLLPMLWDLTTWSTDISDATHSGQFRKSPTFTYQTGGAAGFTDRPNLAQTVTQQLTQAQAHVDALQERITGGLAEGERVVVEHQLALGQQQLEALRGYQQQLIDLEAGHGGRMSSNAAFRFGGYGFALQDVTRAVDTGIDLLDQHALGVNALGYGMGGLVAVARALGLGYHDDAGVPAIAAFGMRALEQGFNSIASHQFFEDDAGLFADNGIHNANVLSRYGLEQQPDGSKNPQLLKYLSLVDAGESAGLTPMAQSLLVGGALQGFYGLQLKKEFGVNVAPHIDMAEESVPSSDGVSGRPQRASLNEMAEIQLQVHEEPAHHMADAANHLFQFAANHGEVNIGFFASFGERLNITTAGTKEVTAALVDPNWQQGVMGV